MCVLVVFCFSWLEVYCKNVPDIVVFFAIVEKVVVYAVYYGIWGLDIYSLLSESYYICVKSKCVFLCVG